MRSPLESGRRAIGALLVVILSMIVVLSIIGIGQRFLGSAVSIQTQRAAVGDMALDLAESAIEEALHQFRTKVNEPGHDFYKWLREDVYGVSTGDRDLTKFIQHKQMDRILAQPAYRKFTLRDLTAQVLYQRQFHQLPYERFGLLKLRAQVKFDLSLTESVTREVEVGVGFKVGLGGPPRPFDQSGFLLLVKGTAPADMEFAELEQKKRDYTALVKETHDDAKARAEHPQTPDQLRDEYREIITLVKPADVWQGKLKDLPTENFLMFAGRPPPQALDVQDLFIFKKLEEKERNELAPAARDVMGALRRATTAPDDLGAHRELIAAYRKRAKALAAQLTLMEEHRQLFDAKPGDVYEAVMKHRYKLRADHWIAKQFYAIDEKPGESADKQLQGFLAGLKKQDGTIGPINGVLKINNRSPVKLANVDIRGKLTVVTAGPGGVQLGGLNRGERAHDLLTVLCTGGPISITGDVHALVLGGEGSSFSASPGATIHGGIALDYVPTPSAREFKVVREQKYFTGTTTEHTSKDAFADYYYVATSPRFAYRKVRR